MIDIPSGPWTLLIAATAAGVLVGLLIALAGRLVEPLVRRTGSTFDDELLHHLRLPFALLGGLATTAALLVRLDTSGGPLPPGFGRFVAIAFILVGAWTLVSAMRLVLARLSSRHDRIQPAARVTGRLVSVVVYVVAFLTILSQYGISITPLLTGLGLAALAVGLALQETLSNFFAGVWIQTERPLSPGHYVRVEAGNQSIEGFVEHVGWRTTRLRLLAGNIQVIPNSRLAQAIVTDFNLPGPQTSVVMTFRLPLDVDPRHAMALLVEEAKEAAKTTPGILQDPAPFANATPGVGESSIGYSLILTVRGFVDQWDAQSAVTTRVWSRLQREGIRLPYPTRINLQADGKEFAPEPWPRPAPRAAHVPEGRDPRQIEAEKATQDIAAATAKKAEEGQVPVAVAIEARQVAQQADDAGAAAPGTAAKAAKPDASEGKA